MIARELRAGDPLPTGDRAQAEAALVCVAQAADGIRDAMQWLRPVAEAVSRGDRLRGAENSVRVSRVLPRLWAAAGDLTWLRDQLERATGRRVHPDAARLIDPAVEDSGGFPLPQAPPWDMRCVHCGCKYGAHRGDSIDRDACPGSALKVLTAARALIAEPEHWCQGAFATTRDGRFTDPDDEDAYRWCLIGAIRRSAPGSRAESLAVATFSDANFGGRSVDLACWQDEPERTHAEVLAVFDRAIARRAP